MSGHRLSTVMSTHYAISDRKCCVQPEVLVDDGVEIRQCSAARQLLPCRIRGRELRSELVAKSSLTLWVSSELDEGPLYTVVSLDFAVMKTRRRTVRLTASRTGCTSELCIWRAHRAWCTYSM